MIKKFVALLLTSVLSKSTKQAITTVKETRGGSTLKITYPPSLAQKFGKTGFIHTSLGNFGHIQYGTTITSQLYFDKENPTGCQSYSKPFQEKKMVLVLDGDCPITQKVRNIEQSGGQLAIIGNALHDNADLVELEDVDGSGFSLHTPAMLISGKDVSLLLDADEAGQLIKLQA